jgi:hypothetical protein
MVNLATTKQKVADADAKQGTGGLLTRKVEVASKALMTKKVNPHQVWQVFGVIDRSGSMADEYRNGTVQDVVNRMLAYAVIVDDDGSVPLIFFDHTIQQYEVKLDDFHNYIGRNRIGAGGSTDLTKALATLAEETGNGDLVASGGFLRRGGDKPPSVKKMSTPAYAIIDGVPNDPASATDMIRKLSWRGVFLKFLFVGRDRRGWEYLESLDDDIRVGVPYERGGRLVDNVDAKNVGDIKNVSDQVFFEDMFDEVTTWLAAAKQNQLI